MNNLIKLSFMELKSLIQHSTELFSLIWKSPEASDKLASNYFRGKKYIGSHDRRFISETVFASLRMKDLAEYCVSNALELSKIKVFNFDNNDKDTKSIINTLTIISSIIISDFYPDIAKPFYPIELLSFSLDVSELSNKISEILTGLLNITEIESNSLITNFKVIFRTLDEKAKEIEKLNTLMNEDDLQILSKRYSYPSWLILKLLDTQFHSRSLCDVCRIAESFLYSAPVTLRVSSINYKREDILNRLNSTNIECDSGELSPQAIILKKRTMLQDNDLFKNGIIELQDEGSQLISYSLAPEENWTILDACAGAGGKTLHLATLQKDNGLIIAADIDFIRIRELNKRARKPGFKSIRTFLWKKGTEIKEQNPDFQRYLRNGFDAVLVDAPCSGTGTARRMPMQKWRLNPKLLERHTRKQLQLLESYSKFVKPGGIIVYATCSILPDENDIIVEKFLENNTEFEPDSLLKVYEKNQIKIKNLKMNEFKLTLLPSEYNCDGFFMARMNKKSV
jgi:16S rRNA (cytosine967-C5)-methyltransferase